MNAKVRPHFLILIAGTIAVIILWVGVAVRRAEPVYQEKPLSYWVTKVGRSEEGMPEDAVAAIRAIGPKAVPFLLEWMPQRTPQHPAFVQWFVNLYSRWFPKSTPKDPPSWDSIEMAWAALGSEGKSAIPTLVHTIDQPMRTLDDYSVWTESAKAISYLGPDAIIPMLTVATNMQGQHDVWELLHNFQNLGSNGAPAVPALIHWANDPDYWVREGVVSALDGIGQRPDLAVPVLINALHDSDSMVRRDAARAIATFADYSGAALPDLITLFNDPDWQARGSALSAIVEFRNKSETVVPLIAAHLNDDNPAVQRYAAEALRDIGSKTSIDALEKASDNSNISDIVDEARQKKRESK